MTITNGKPFVITEAAHTSTKRANGSTAAEAEDEDAIRDAAAVAILAPSNGTTKNKVVAKTSNKAETMQAVGTANAEDRMEEDLGAAHISRTSIDYLGRWRYLRFGSAVTTYYRGRHSHSCWCCPTT